MPLLLIVALGAWFLFGDPPKDVARWFWPDDAAPWETVDAFFYPNRSDLTVFQTSRGLPSAQECRDWVYATAALSGDGGLTIGDYECGVGLTDSFEGMSVYRTTVR